MTAHERLVADAWRYAVMAGAWRHGAVGHSSPRGAWPQADTGPCGSAALLAVRQVSGTPGWTTAYQTQEHHPPTPFSE
jgi:hypothetical protein